MFQESQQQGGAAAPRLKIKMLRQMAEALEDEAEGLYHRVAAFEEEEFTLTYEIEERQTEINRLTLKLDSLRSDRDALMAKIESLRAEAAAMIEEVFSSEEEIALASLEITPIDRDESAGLDVSPDSISAPRGSLFFRRMMLGDEAR
jgi:chromosome segregation ATPase